MFIVGVVGALASGASFAAAGVLQKEAANDAPPQDALHLRLFEDVLRRPRWLAGILMAVVAYAFQALALSAAPLALVQPLIVSELLFALPISMRQRKLRLTRRNWASVLAVAGGLAAALWCASPHNGTGSASVTSWVTAQAVLVIVAGGLGVLGWRYRGTARAGLLAGGAAVLFAGSSTLLSQFVHELTTAGLTAALASWAPYGMAVFSLSAFLFIQSAFQSGPLAVVMPVSDALEPLVAALLGVIVLHETINTSPGRLVGLFLAGVVLIVGIVTLDSSANIHLLEQIEGERPSAAEAAAPVVQAASCRATRRYGTAFVALWPARSFIKSAVSRFGRRVALAARMGR